MFGASARKWYPFKVSDLQLTKKWCKSATGKRIMSYNGKFPATVIIQRKITQLDKKLPGIWPLYKIFFSLL